jgi:metal-responsive CopG/Arc/MetJ family transcriptional regulator
MPRRLSFVCEDDLLQRVDVLAREYGLSRQEVLRQAVETGLESIESDHSRRRA